MRAYLSKCVLGVFAYDEGGKPIGSEAFPREPGKVARLLMESEAGLLEEEKRLIGRLEGYEVVLEGEVSAEGATVQSPNPAGELLRRDLEGAASSLGVSKRELRTFIHEVSLELSRLKVREASKEKDRAVIQGSEALEDLDEALNLLSERLREWCSIHLPSLERGLEHRGYMEKICTLKAEDASGMGEKEREAVRSYSGQIRALYALRDGLEGYISSAMEETAPNLKALLGPSLGAKLLSVAGGLSSLARMPASRIQVLGAEKAMFRHLRKKGPPPKHGIIYQHPLIQKSPWWQRGKISRALAGKVAIACRVDALSGEYIGDELKERLSKRVEEIRAVHPTAPKKGRQ